MDLMPIRGHSSVQGGAEMELYSTVFPGGVPVNASNARQLSEQYGFQVPDWPGYSAVEMIEAASKGDLDILYSVGGNFLRTLPEPKRVADALCKVKVRVHQDILLRTKPCLKEEKKSGYFLQRLATSSVMEGSKLPLKDE